MEEKNYIRACQQGNKESFEYIVTLYRRKAYLAALATMGKPEDALDASQEAFIRAFRNIRKFDIQRSFYPWFYQILKNCCYTLIHKRQKVEEFFGEKSDWRLDPAILIEKTERQEFLLKAMNQLPEEDAELLNFKYFQELKYCEIAEILKVPIGTVMSRLYKSSQSFKKLMRRVFYMKCEEIKPLLMGFLDDEIGESERFEVKAHLEICSNCRQELNSFQKLEEVAGTMKFLEPSEQAWKNYWANIYNRLERKFAWISISLGIMTLVGFAVYKMFEDFFLNPKISIILKTGVSLLIVGAIALIVSLIRERLSLLKYDKYREVQQ